MSCNHCQMRVKKALESIDEIENAEADFKKGTATITIPDGSNVDMDKISEVIEDVGYQLLM